MTVTLGDVLTIAGIAITGMSVYVAITNRITALEIKLEPIWRWFIELDERSGTDRRRRDDR